MNGVNYVRMTFVYVIGIENEKKLNLAADSQVEKS